MCKLRNVYAGMICVTAMGAAAARADVLTVGASQDAMIFATSAGVDTGKASGKGPALFAGADGSSNKKRSLIEFNVSAIPANATITNATVTLYLAQVAGSGGGSGFSGTLTLSLYDLLQSWSEGNSGSPTSASVGGTGQGYAEQNGDSTWTDATYNSNPSLAVPWATPGGSFASTASASNTATASALNTPYTWSSTQLAADVQSWVSGTTPNDGWELISNLETTPTSFLGFWSKDGAAANNNPAIAPSLSITYTVPAPEPTTLGLLAVGAMGMMARRRRNTVGEQV
jgi:hypothetical protein